MRGEDSALFDYEPDNRQNPIRSNRGAAVLSEWRSYELSNISNHRRRISANIDECNNDWFGSIFDGPLWISIGIDEYTGQFQAPIPNKPPHNHAREFEDLKGCDASQSRSHDLNCPLPTIRQSAFLEIPLGTDVVSNVLKQWLVGDSRAGVRKPMMMWNVSERNNSSAENMPRNRKSARRKLFSRRKVISIVFSHLMKVECL
eukprot:IDg6584t1